MPPSLSELKVRPSFCFAFKIPENVTTTIIHTVIVQIIREYSVKRKENVHSEKMLVHCVLSEYIYQTTINQHKLSTID